MLRVQQVLFRRPIYCIKRSYFSNTIVAKQKDTSPDQSKETVQLDNKHVEFTKNFISTLKLSIPQALESPPVDKTVQEADQRIAVALKNLFSKQKVEVTEELLQRRQKLREKYLELFKDL